MDRARLAGGEEKMLHVGAVRVDVPGVVTHRCTLDRAQRHPHRNRSRGVSGTHSGDRNLRSRPVKAAPGGMSARPSGPRCCPTAAQRPDRKVRQRRYGLKHKRVSFHGSGFGFSASTCPLRFLVRRDRLGDQLGGSPTYPTPCHNTRRTRPCCK
jgi:hypothetical protein